LPGDIPGALIVFGLGLAGGWSLSSRHFRANAEQEERQAELERMQQRSDQLLAEYEQTGQGWFWETDRRGMITYVSPRIARLLKSSSEAMIGRPFTEMFVLDNQERESERTLNFHLSTRSSFQDL